MTVIVPEKKLTEEMSLGTVTLKVKNLSRQTEFYQKVMGLSVLEKTDKTRILGVEKAEPLLKLIQLEQGNVRRKKTGLYHIALLVPSRKALGETLLHFLQVNAPLEGASDHGYSEALYLTDPEGNGIEVYRDKPRAAWDIRDDGEIVGVTLEMDAQGVLAEAQDVWHGLEKGTVIGHVHLQVADLQRTEAFYTDILGLTLTNNFGAQAKFFAAGDYHHHIGANTWQGSDAALLTAKDHGLESFVMLVPAEEIERLAEHFKAREIAYHKTEKGLWLFDPNGIKIIFLLK